MESRPKASTKKLRRTVAGYSQRTFGTPVKDLARFVGILLGGEPAVAATSLTIEQIVLTPYHLEKLLTAKGLPKTSRAATLVTEGHEESLTLLQAALSDSIDFFLVPEPKRFILFADHDEFTTLFAARKGALSAIAASMIAAGFSEMQDYVREF